MRGHARRWPGSPHQQRDVTVEVQPGAQLGDPSSFDPSIYNDCLTILTRQPEAIEDTCVPDCLSVFRFVLKCLALAGAVLPEMAAALPHTADGSPCSRVDNHPGNKIIAERTGLRP